VPAAWPPASPSGMLPARPVGRFFVNDRKQTGL
jgi:hypothetical protein